MRLALILAVVLASGVVRAGDDSNYRHLNNIVWRHLEEIELTCFTGEALPKSVELFVGNAVDGALELSSKTDDAFSRCFATELRNRLRPTAKYYADPIVLLPLKLLLENTVSELPCGAHSGSVPKYATIDFRHAAVTTEPANEETQLCIAQRLQQSMPAFRRHADTQVTIALRPRITTKHVYEVLMDAPRIAWSCVGSQPPGEVRIIVRGHEGDTHFESRLPGASSPFETCVRGKLEPLFERILDERHAPRIDSEIEASLTFTLVRGR